MQDHMMILAKIIMMGSAYGQMPASSCIAIDSSYEHHGAYGRGMSSRGGISFHEE
jgi:hypothetical protein